MRHLTQRGVRESRTLASATVALLVVLSAALQAQQTGLPTCTGQRMDPSSTNKASCGTSRSCVLPSCLDFVNVTNFTSYHPCTSSGAVLGDNCVNSGEVNCGVRGTCTPAYNALLIEYCKVITTAVLQGEAPVDGGSCTIRKKS